MSALERLGIHLAATPPNASGVSANQGQTRDAFGFKWSLRDTYESKHVAEATRSWLVERYCGGDESVLDHWVGKERPILLDAGCGSAFSALLLFGKRLNAVDYLGVDISDAVSVARQRLAEAGVRGDFLQADLMRLPIPDGSVDIIFSEGVLHHTDSTEEAVRALAKKLKGKGLFLFYVYAKKAAIRELSDDYIRQELAGLSDEEAWRALEPLTRLGIALGRLGVEIEVPEDIPLLGIKKGRLDIQRFFYWNICKLYFRPEYSLEEMNHINFDWFRPLNCHRHTPEEVRRWCSESHLTIERMDVQESGISVVARKQYNSGENG